MLKFTLDSNTSEQIWSSIQLFLRKPVQVRRTDVTSSCMQFEKRGLGYCGKLSGVMGSLLAESPRGGEIKLYKFISWYLWNYYRFRLTFNKNIFSSPPPLPRFQPTTDSPSVQKASNNNTCPPFSRGTSVRLYWTGFRKKPIVCYLCLPFGSWRGHFCLAIQLLGSC